MIIDPLYDLYWGHKGKAKILVIGVVGVLWVFSDLVFEFVSIRETLLLLTVFALFILEVIENHLQDLEAAVEVQTPIDVYSNRNEVNPQLKDIIDSESPSRVYMLEYSSVTIHDVIGSAVDAGSELYLLLKHPTTAINQSQEARIVNQLKNLYEEYRDFDRLQIRFYQSPASLRARKIDDTHVALGWYTFDSRDSRDRQIWGHDNPMVILSAEALEEFSVVNGWFMQVFHRMWVAAPTLHELYRDESTDFLRKWVEDEATTSAEQREIEQWIQQVSSEEDPAIETLFPGY